jgi:hypothetical protein
MNQVRHLLGSNLAPSDAVSGTGGFTIDVVRYDRSSVPPPPRPPIPIWPAQYLGDIMHHISDANGATGSSIMSVLLAAPPYMALVHCTVLHCNISVVYACVAPPIGEVVDSYDRRINTSNIAVSAYYMVTNHSAEDDAHSSIMAYDCHINMVSHDYWRWVNTNGIVSLCHLTSIQSILIGLYTVSNHGVVTSDVHQRTGMIQHATTTRSLGRQHEVTTSTIVNYRHKAGVDGQLVVLSTSTTSHVLVRLPYLLSSTGASHARCLPYLLFSTGTSHALSLPHLPSTGTSHAPPCLPYPPSTGTSHVLLGPPYLLDIRHSCPHVVGNAWDQFSHVLMACEVDWGPLIIIDGELSLGRH